MTDQEILQRAAELQKEQQLETPIQINGEDIIKWKDFINKKDEIKCIGLDLTMPNTKPNRLANCIAIGGMIAMGKSTLAKALYERFAEYSTYVEELDETDEYTMLLLDKMYQRENEELYGPMFQLNFVLQRYLRYKEVLEKTDKLVFFDRTIFEDFVFAVENIKSPATLKYYTALYDDICTKLRYKEGVPQWYIILDGDWELFKERIYKRGRKSEIENFEKNEDYFRHLQKNYVTWLKGICNSTGISCLVVDAKLSTEEQVDYIVNALQLRVRKEEEEEN